MNKGRLVRTSVFIGQRQLDQLRQISAATDVPIAVMVRRGVQLYLDAGVGAPASRGGAGSPDAGSQDVPGTPSSYAVYLPSHL